MIKAPCFPADPLPMPATAERITDGDWTKLALCAGRPDRGSWFPDDYSEEAVARAVAICRVCPVRVDCLTYVITNKQTDGVWGGTTPAQRGRMVRATRRGR
jgi:WhiB family transcriptional regulator, redox-sensing transcriptional regulator